MRLNKTPGPDTISITQSQILIFILKSNCKQYRLHAKQVQETQKSDLLGKLSDRKNVTDTKNNFKKDETNQ